LRARADRRADSKAGAVRPMERRRLRRVLGCGPSWGAEV
jgi:hypothetical protein